MPAAVFTVSNAEIVEGNEGQQQVAVVVSLTSPHGNAVTVDYRSLGGTATEGTDYTAVSGKLSFTKDQSSKTILVNVRGDRTAEPDEQFSIVLSNAKGAKIQDGTGVVTIREPRISITDVWDNEGNSGTTPFKFTISLSAASDLPVTVNYATADGSAIAGSDYTGLSGAYTFTPGETSKDIYVDVTGDRAVESNETFVVNLTSSDAQMAKGVGTGNIIDDEPQINISDAYFYDDGYSEPVLTFYVTLSTATDEVVTVDYATLDGAAIDGVDYVGTTGTLTFAPDETVQTITVAVNPASYDTYFFVQLFNASANASIYYEWGVGYLNYYGYWGY
ncbi:MAG TPA: Calx-beta domain-containing protein [Caulifigura sp.]|nr:Calx-beta domain-containing protein [Caulifigura sp.]